MRRATVRPQGRVRLSIRTPSLPQEGFLGCSALVTHTINKSCTGRHDMLMGSLAGFHSGRDTESYSHELFTALELLCAVRCFSFCPQVTKLCGEARLDVQWQIHPYI